MAFRRDRPSRACAHLRCLRALLVVPSFALALLVATPALAQRDLLTKAGQKGQIVIDQISGFRGGVSEIVPNSGGTALTPSMNYYGPIGFAVQRYSEASAVDGPNTNVATATTFWLAPSADYFVINHLSIGGMVQIAYTTTSLSLPINPTQSQSHDVPSNTSFAVMPRVGWMFALSDRWAIWPRLSLGYVSNAVGSVAAAPGMAGVGGLSIYGFAMDFDAGVLFRVNETFFLRLAPEIGWIPGGASSTTNGAGVSTTQGASYFEFSLAGGIGVMFDL
jgi:hypothetical protein